MVKGWQKQFETDSQRREFEEFFKEFEFYVRHWPEDQRQNQGPINQFLMGQIVLLRDQIKQLKEERKSYEQRGNA